MSKRKSGSSYSEQMQRLASQFLEQNQGEPATAKEMARWLINNKLWQPHPSSIVKLCAEELAKAMREEYITDPQGRRVRAKHAAKIKIDETGKQRSFWDDMRTASHEHMETSLKQRRRQIVGDCWQLKLDADSYNDNRKPPRQILIPFDFTPDMEERALMGI